MDSAGEERLPMLEQTRKYVIIGGGWRARPQSTGSENSTACRIYRDDRVEQFRPYNRPPLSKTLWFGKQTADQIFLRDENYYAGLGVDMVLGTDVMAIDAQTGSSGPVEAMYVDTRNLLIATGGAPRS